MDIKSVIQRKKNGASAGIRTRDPHLTKVVRYHAMPLRRRNLIGAEGGRSAKPNGLRFEPAISRFLRCASHHIILTLGQSPMSIALLFQEWLQVWRSTRLSYLGSTKPQPVPFKRYSHHTFHTPFSSPFHQHEAILSHEITFTRHQLSGGVSKGQRPL